MGLQAGNIGLDGQPGTPYLMTDNDDIRSLLEGRRSELQRIVEQRRDAVREAEEKLAKAEIELRTLEAALRAIRNEEVHSPFSAPAQNLTIKQGVLRILERVTPEGLSAITILDRLGKDLDMHYPRTSLSPQLSRLKREGKINLRGNRWFLNQDKNSSGA